MDERVAKLRTPEDCEALARNAAERGRADLVQDARQRAVELRAAAYGAKSAVERECIEAVYAYEEVLSLKNGRRTRASRTWQMIKRLGVLQAVDRVVSRDAETVGYATLLDVGLQRFAFESVVVRNPTLFSPDAVKRARRRVAEWDKG